MDAFKFSELISYQVAHTKLVSYENELNTFLATNNDDNFALRRRMTTAWFTAFKGKFDPTHISVEDAVQRANKLREEGNVLYNSKVDSKTRNIIGAGQSYTQAVFTAPAETEALALAYANRAMVLQKLGYYRQAYDDCCCALETNHYPPRLIHKIKIRQAYCSLYLKDSKKLATHLHELVETNFNENFRELVEELRSGLESLTEDLQKQDVYNEKEHVEKIAKGATKIVESNEAIRGRYMVATKAIKSGEVIFSETISSFVPVGDCQMCQQCGATLMIPIPCHSCNSKVLYCSLTCRKAHTAVHRNECLGYRWRLFEQIGISHLALRIVLDELPTIMPFIRHKTDVNEVWFALTAPNGLLQVTKPVKYAQTLGMITHLSQMPVPDVLWFALVADLLVVYLSDHTTFFDIMKNTQMKRSDWELVTSALILRHIGQLIVNAHTCVSIIPIQYDVSPASNGIGLLLSPNLWIKPFHLRRGRLHLLGEYREVSAANIPYLSICNHACAPSLRHKFSGRHYYALASDNIENGGEILNCYTLNFRNSLRKTRRNYLKDIYRFDCSCAKCKKSNPDEDYLIYHRYKCRNPKCGETFVPDINKNQSLHWWQIVDEHNAPLECLYCPACAEKQDVEWFSKFKQLLKHSRIAEERAELFRLYTTMDDFLLDFNSLKLSLGSEFVSACINSRDGGCEFADDELINLTKVLKFCLNGTADQCGSQSIEYVVTMTFLWDLIAAGIYHCEKLEMNTMLRALDVVSEEYKLVFLNYYKDYIEKLVK